MFVTEEEAAAMYAGACRGWYGTKAKSVIRAKIRALKAKGDDKGVEAWERVARALVLPTYQSRCVPIILTHRNCEMTSRQRCELVSHFLKTRHGIEVCRPQSSQVDQWQSDDRREDAPHDIAIMIKSNLES